jgi:hypothetical protein
MERIELGVRRTEPSVSRTRGSASLPSLSRLSQRGSPLLGGGGNNGVHKSRVADPFVHQVNIGSESEGRISVSKLGGHLLHIASGFEKQRGAGVTERVERDPLETRRLGHGDENAAPDVAVAKRKAVRAGEHPFRSRTIGSAYPQAIREARCQRNVSA